MRQTTIFDDTVAHRIERLLARCEGVRRASDLDRQRLVRRCRRGPRGGCGPTRPGEKQWHLVPSRNIPLQDVAR